MNRIESTYNDGDEDPELYELTEEEEELYKELKEMILTICAKGEFDESTVNLDRDSWKIIGEFCCSKKFENAIKDRFEPDSTVIGLPISDINSGFFTLCQQNFWTKYHQPFQVEYFYCMRKPDSGLPTITDIELTTDDEKSDGLKEFPFLEFTEFPGRTELLSDFSEMIVPDDGFKRSVVLFVVSLFDLDNQIRDANGKLKLEIDVVFNELKNINNKTKDLPVIIHYTKNQDTRAKWRYFKERDMLQERLEVIGVDPSSIDQAIFGENVAENKYMSVVFKEMKNLVHRKVMQIGFKRQNILKIQRIGDLKGDETERTIFYTTLTKALDKTSKRA